MAKKGSTRIKNSAGLTEREKNAIINYIGGEGSVRDKELKSILDAGYKFEGQHRDQNARGEMRRILKKPESKAYINDLMREREGAFVYDKMWIQDEMKKLFYSTKSDQVKRGLLDSMAKTLGMFEDKVNITSSDKDPAKIARAAFDEKAKARILAFKEKKNEKSA